MPVAVNGIYLFYCDSTVINTFMQEIAYAFLQLILHLIFLRINTLTQSSHVQYSYR